MLVADEEGNCKITDFGIAQIANRRQRYNVYTAIEPPEKKFSKKSDVFMYGLLLFEVLEKTHPNSSTFRVEIPRMPIDEKPRSRLVELIQKCCVVLPSDRPEFDEIVVGLNKMRLDLEIIKPFPKLDYKIIIGSNNLSVGMKLEARDIKNPTLICVASIAAIDKVSKEETKVLITFDGWSSNFDYWTTLKNPEHVGPIGACQKMGVELQKPKNYKGNFNWKTYLKETNSNPVPEAFFVSPVLQNYTP